MTTQLISTDWCELQPAYGRDYKSKAEVVAAFNAGQDFEGDVNLGFKLCSTRDFEVGTRVMLRYKKNTQVAVTTVK